MANSTVYNTVNLKKYTNPYLNKLQHGLIYNAHNLNPENPYTTEGVGSGIAYWSQASRRYRTYEEQQTFKGVDQKLPPLWSIGDFEIVCNYYIQTYLVEEKHTLFPTAAIELQKYLPQHSLPVLLQNLTKCKSISIELSEIINQAYAKSNDLNKAPFEPRLLSPTFFKNPYNRDVQLSFTKRTNNAFPIGTPIPATTDERAAFFISVLHSPLVHWFKQQKNTHI